jgi:hypothetical protein
MKRSLFTLAFLTLTLPASAQGVDPLLGKWKVNVEKSKTDFPQAKLTVNTYAKEAENIVTRIGNTINILRFRQGKVITVPGAWLRFRASCVAGRWSMGTAWS